MMTSEHNADTPVSTDLASIAEFVALLSQQMRASGLTSLDVQIPEARIRLRSEKRAIVHEPSNSAVATDPLAVDDEDTSTSDEDDGYAYVSSPMIGTFYAASGPGEPPFVEVGDIIAVGQTVAIIEAMKIMNEIVADHAGKVVEILVRNAEAVEYGQPLFRLAPEHG